MSVFLRRNRIDQMVPAEKAILAAVEEVEHLGCDVLLTEAVILLQTARDKVADFVDTRPRVDCTAKPVSARVYDKLVEASEVTGVPVRHIAWAVGISQSPGDPVVREAVADPTGFPYRDTDGQGRPTVRDEVDRRIPRPGDEKPINDQ